MDRPAERIVTVGAAELEQADDQEDHLDRRKGPPVALKSGGGLLRRVTTFLALASFAVLVVVPFLYMALMSLKRPMEFGNGRLLPQGLQTILQPDGGLMALYEVKLSGEGAATLGQTAGRPVIVDMETTTLMPGMDHAWARLLSMEKTGLARDEFSAILEARAPTSANPNPSTSTLLIPTERGWLAAQATPLPDRNSQLVKLLLKNYAVLAKWDDLASGRLLAWVSSGYPRWFLNSLLVAAVAVVIGVFFDSLAAFAFAKYRFPGRRLLFILLIGTLMVPYPVTLVPTFFIYAQMGLYNTYTALIIPGMSSAFGIFLVKQYMQSIPDEFLDAGRVDGAGEFHIYSTIVVPLATPVLAALCVFRFIFQWNSYLFPLVFTNSDSMKTLQLGLATMEDPHGAVDYGMLMAGATLAVVPVVSIYALMQRHFISCITMGGVKG